MQPDVEKVIGELLRDSEDIADIVGARVGGKHPRTLAEPWVKITQIADVTIGNKPIYLVAVDLQIDCYGSDNENEAHSEASTLARTVKSVLSTASDQEYADCVVTDVKFGPTSRVPDQDFEPSRERFIVQATVYAHGV